MGPLQMFAWYECNIVGLRGHRHTPSTPQTYVREGLQRRRDSFLPCNQNMSKLESTTISMETHRLSLMESSFGFNSCKKPLANRYEDPLMPNSRWIHWCPVLVIGRSLSHKSTAMTAWINAFAECSLSSFATFNSGCEPCHARGMIGYNNDTLNDGQDRGRMAGNKNNDSAVITDNN